MSAREMIPDTFVHRNELPVRAKLLISGAVSIPNRDVCVCFLSRVVPTCIRGTWAICFAHQLFSGSGFARMPNWPAVGGQGSVFGTRETCREVVEGVVTWDGG